MFGQPAITGGRAWHRPRRNETSRQPRRHIFLDTETYKDRVPGGHEQRFAVAVACFREARKGRQATERWEIFDDPDCLWGAVTVWCGTSGRTVLWAHNLGFDARIGEALYVLPRLGWRLVAHNISTKAPWLSWRREGATLLLVDSAGVFPTTLGAVGKTVGMGKRRLPAAGQGGVGLYSRCWRDVEILRAAVVAYLAWLDSDDLGNWQVTGSGQSWATYRHKFLDESLTVHADAEALTAERRAMWTGRCEAYWHGEIGYQVVHEWDFSLAYGRIAGGVHVPVRLVGPVPNAVDALRYLDSRRVALLADVRVTTGVPVVPTLVDGRVAWPVGTFDTTLWGVEIRAALDAGATVVVRRAWLYRKGPALKEWAEWIMALVESTKDGREGWKHIVGKHQMRALIGRLAMSHTTWDEWAAAPTESVRSYPVWDANSGETYRVAHVGRQVFRESGRVEWEHSMPMITGYVQAVARVRLWQLMQEMPKGACLYCDTDGVLVTDQFLYDMQEIANRHPGWGLRLKRSWTGIAIWGPRQVITGPLVRISGLPRDAERVDRRQWRGEVWESLQGALVTGNTARVRTRDRTWTIRGVDARRAGPEIGWTWPILVGGGADG